MAAPKICRPHLNSLYSTMKRHMSRSTRRSSLRERPTQLRRFPDGISGEQIYQKRVPEKRPDWIEVAELYRELGEWDQVPQLLERGREDQAPIIATMRYLLTRKLRGPARYGRG